MVATEWMTPEEAGVKVGDVFYSSWGYNQTNIDFYEVVALTPKCAKVRGLKKRQVGSNGYEDEVVPATGPDRFGAGERNAKAMTKRLRKAWRGTVAFNLTSFSDAYQWDGTPQRRTNSHFGH